MYQLKLYEKDYKKSNKILLFTLFFAIFLNIQYFLDTIHKLALYK